MSVFKFEIKKLWSQKKFLWLFLITILVISALFIQNNIEQERMAERALEAFQPLQDHTYSIREELNTLKREGTLSEAQADQLGYVQNMGSALMFWEAAIDHGNWSDIPGLEHDFLQNVLKYEEAGGEFIALAGVDREIAISKNEVLVEQGLSYEDESYPVSPHLFVKDGVNYLHSLLGVTILIIFFANSITIEKEQRTWLILKTQPLTSWKLVFGKFTSVLVTMIIFIVMVLSFGLVIPLLFGDQSLNMHYPQVTNAGDSFLIISTFHYVIRGVVLFSCVSMFSFSLAFLLSKWLKKTFTLIMSVACILFLGYLTTESIALLQAPWNPFQYFRFNELLNEIPNRTDLLYPLLAMLWSLVLIILTVFLPDKGTGKMIFDTLKEPFHHGVTRSYSYNVWNMSIFEWRKLKRNSILFQIYLLLILGVAFGYYMISQEAVEKETTYIDHLRKMVYEELYSEHLKERLVYYEGVIENAELSGDEPLAENFRWLLELAEEGVEFIQYRESMQRAAIEDYEQGDWISLYEYQLFENEFVDDNDAFESGNIGNLRKQDIGQFTVDVSIAEKYWLMEHHIQPVFSGEYVSTIHEHWGAYAVPHFRDEWREENRKVDNSGLFSVYLLFQQYFFFIPILLFVFLLGGGFASERGKKATLHFLMTQPVAIKNIFLGKIISATSISLLSGAGLVVIVLLLGTVFNRFGDWMYPILHYNSDKVVHSADYEGMVSAGNGFHFVPLGEIVLLNSLLFLLILLFFITLSLVLSLVMKNLLSVLTTTVLIGAGGYWVSNQLLTERAHLSPFTYLDIPKITNGEIATLLNNPGVNALTGTFAMLVPTIILLMVGYIWLSFKNKKSKVAMGEESKKKLEPSPTKKEGAG